MKHTCIKCDIETEEPNDKFCHECIAKKAFQMYCRTGKSNTLYNWFWAIEEITYEVNHYTYK